MKKLFTILLIMFAVQVMAQDLNKAYKEYCTEGAKMHVDSTIERGTVEVEVILTPNGIEYGKRDTTWFGNYRFLYADDFTYTNTTSSGHYSCTGSTRWANYEGGVTYVVPKPKKYTNKTYYSKPKTTMSFSIQRTKYTEYYYKEPKQTFEDWLKRRNYLK